MEVILGADYFRKKRLFSTVCLSMERTKTLTWGCEPVKLDGPFGYFSCKNGKLWEGGRKLSYFAVLLTAATSLSGQNSVY